MHAAAILNLTERIFTPYLGKGKLGRAYMILNADDLAEFDRLPKNGMHRETVEVFDTVSQSFFTVRRADCGSNCFCAAEIVEARVA